jgi:hypothetical protein
VVLTLVHHNCYACAVKKTTLPPLRVNPKLRREIEAVLEEDETLSAFMLEAIEARAQSRREQRAFVDKALARSKDTAKTKKYVAANAVFKRLEQVLTRAKVKVRKG